MVCYQSKIYNYFFVKSLMKTIKKLVILFCLVFVQVAHAETREIIGLGMAESSMMGKDFAVRVASTEARKLIASQVAASEFRYTRNEYKTQLTKTTQAEVVDKGIQEIFKNNFGVGVILASTTDFVPSYKGEICHTTSSTVTSQDDLNRLRIGQLKNIITEIMKSENLEQTTITGVAYIKNLQVTINNSGESAALNFVTCVADLK